MAANAYWKPEVSNKPVLLLHNLSEKADTQEKMSFSTQSFSKSLVKLSHFLSWLHLKHFIQILISVKIVYAYYLTHSCYLGHEREKVRNTLP